MTEQQYEDWESNRPFKDITDDERQILIIARFEIDEKLKLFYKSNHVVCPDLSDEEIRKRDKEDEKRLRRALNYMHQLSPATIGYFEPDTISPDAIVSFGGKVSNGIFHAALAILPIVFMVYLSVLITGGLMWICELAKKLF
ncbi:hypothetical protein [Burkholderia gladioli]|uniref:hypothetical protein n=1 Tax=Burkholderia gladioli TaxID=28095 RepID=UPI001641D158|nr:hypothetical protein [Burkholderia gladioli]